MNERSVVSFSLRNYLRRHFLLHLFQFKIKYLPCLSSLSFTYQAFQYPLRGYPDKPDHYTHDP